MKHIHHIIPKHMGGSDDPSNLVSLSIEEHAETHRLLWEEYGKIEDFGAWKLLSGRTKEAEEVWREMTIQRNKLGKGVPLTTEHKEKISKSLKKIFSDGNRDLWLHDEARLSKMTKGFQQFLLTEASSSWKQNISNSLTGKSQSPESRAKKSDSLKRSYANGERDSHLRHLSKEYRQEIYDGERLAEGRRNSKKWKDSVTSDEYKRKKAEADPRSKTISVNGTPYPSIRTAAKSLGIPYSRLRNLLDGKNILTLPDV